jgi:formate/nitrite transporter FocA (FNT family)
VEDWRSIVALVLAVGFALVLVRLLLAMLNVVSSTAKTTKGGPYNRLLGFVHLFNLVGLAAVVYAQLLFNGEPPQIPLDIAGVACLVVGLTWSSILERKAQRLGRRVAS